MVWYGITYQANSLSFVDSLAYQPEVAITQWYGITYQPSSLSIRAGTVALPGGLHLVEQILNLFD